MATRKEILEIGGREVAVSNPDKVYFPRAGHTKLDLVRYFLAVADGALVGVRGRPMALKRFVDGAEKEPFFQKRAPDNRPEWMRVATLTFPSGRTADELVVDEAAGLAWVANLGCLDLNPHPVRAEDLDHPDELRIDLDPVPGVPWSDVREVALVCREALEAVGLVGWPKTSGSRGIHINVRIEPRWTYPEVRRAALALARDVERRAPVDRHQQVVEGGAPRRLPGLQPEREGPDRRVRLLRAAHAGRTGLVPAALGRGAGLRHGGLHAGDGPRAVRGARRRRRGDRRAPSARSRRCWSCRSATRPRARATRRGRPTTPSRRASRRASSRLASGAPMRTTRAAVSTAVLRPRSPKRARPRWRRVTRTPGCRRSGRARARRPPGAAAPASR